MESTPKLQPLRLVLQCSFIIESSEEGQAIYEEVSTFVKGVQSGATVGGQLITLLGPCCPERKK